MANFTQSIREAAAKIRARLAPDADTAGGLNAAGIAATFTKSDVGKSNVPNYARASTNDVKAGTSTSKLVTVNQVALMKEMSIAKIMDQPLKAGQILYGDDSSDAMNIVADNFYQKTFIVENAEEVEHAKNVEASLKEMFDTWYRFSHKGTNLPQPQLPNELTSWSYTEATDTVACTINSSSHIGFVSSERYDAYTLEVELSSTNADDDTIGIILAYVKVDGIEYTLTAQRSMGGFGALFNITYCLGGGNTWTVKSSGNFENYKNGTNTNGRPGTNGWSGKKVKMHVHRDGNIITVKASEPNQAAYKDSETLVVDLSSDARLHKFQGLCAYGYSCFSQALSTWKVLARPGAYQDFLDTRTMTLWRHNGVEWVGTPESESAGVIKRNRLYLNTDSYKLYYFPMNGDIYKVGDYRGEEIGIIPN